MSANSAVGLDIGHSAVKGACDELQVVFKSIAAPAIRITDEATRAQSAYDTVTVNGRPYFVGETALVQRGHVVSGLADDWINTPEYSALALAAKDKLHRGGVRWDYVKHLVVGLPNRLHASHHHNLHDVTRELFPEVGEIHVKPQALGPYIGMMITTGGFPLRRAAQERWGVIDVGHYTTDFVLYERGQWVEQANVSCAGLSVAIAEMIRLLHIKGIDLSLDEAEQSLMTRNYKHYGKTIDISSVVEQAIAVYQPQIIDAAKRSLGSRAKALDGILLAGGAAPVVLDALKNEWEHVQLADNPRFSVAEGFRRYGLAKANADGS